MPVSTEAYVRLKERLEAVRLALAIPEEFDPDAHGNPEADAVAVLVAHRKDQLEAQVAVIARLEREDEWMRRER